MNIYELFPSPYVRAGDLPATGIIVTIKSVVIEDLRNNKTKKIERKPVMYFHKAKKGMVLNKTNGFIIAGLYGPDMDGWPGQRIELYPTRVEAFGTMQDAIRVRERRYEAQTDQPIEHAPVLESQEDVLDHEPDDEDVDGDFRAVDADTGEITYRAPATPRSAPAVQPQADVDMGMGNPFDDAAPAKRGTITDGTMKRLHVLGNEVYGKAWDAKRPTLVRHVTTGEAESAADLLEEEARKLCAGMEAKAAKMRQPDAQPQAEAEIRY